MDEATFNGHMEHARHTYEQIIRLTGETPAEQLLRLYWLRPPETRRDLIRDLIYCSEEIAGAWDGLTLIAERLLRERPNEIPPELRQWIAERLATPPRERPTRRGQDPDALVGRDRAIVIAVKDLTERGMTATRNSNRYGAARASFKGGSACDAVGVALGMGYKNVERIWTGSASPVSPIYRGAHWPYRWTGTGQPVLRESEETTRTDQ